MHLSFYVKHYDQSEEDLLVHSEHRTTFCRKKKTDKSISELRYTIPRCLLFDHVRIFSLFALRELGSELKSKLS